MEVNNKISNISNLNVNATNETISHNNIAKEQVTKTQSIDINSQNNNINNNNNNQNNSEKKSISRETLDKLVTEVNNKYKLANKEFSYSIHEKTNRVTVKIKDSETGDIIKELPSEESLDLAAKIMEMAGLLIDERS